MRLRVSSRRVLSWSAVASGGTSKRLNFTIRLIGPGVSGGGVLHSCCLLSMGESCRCRKSASFMPNRQHFD